MTIKTAISLGAFSLALGGCGTVATVLQDDAEVARCLRKQKTYCQSIPRIYSGVAYDFCVLNGPPNSMVGVTMSGVPWVYFDFLVSGAFDTVVLPYTIYRQSTDGSIDIR
ncbi:YceK/YidQ family lipoprotein [Pseudomonas sp. H3(2019)]|uniref:YceK/YidQ family lipoprotein n=1 Tax=Pseudomonas sp. H3(2019) TaxID=2598724 RepID=UPI001197CE22|nr:YceK/YidQ family lipoprotein [Pseudomonas sp. H3(2019)]TVT81561.1 YceK/YidQ family lipoprotein [Pseudomonas sp. H3(2019)]